MKNSWFERCRLLAVGAVLVAVLCGTSVAFAFTDIPALPGYPENIFRSMEFRGELLTGASSTSDHVVRGFFFFAGEGVDLSLVGQGSQIGMSVFPKDAISVIGSVPYTATGVGASPRALSFIAPYSGFYYVDVYAVSTSGNYVLTLVTRIHTDLTVAPVGNLSFGNACTVSGTMTGAALGEPIEGDVVLSGSLDGIVYHPVASQPLTDGAFAFDALVPLQTTYYKVQYLGNSKYNPSGDKIVVRTTASLSKVSARRYGTRSYTLSGLLRPGINDGDPAATVRVYLWRYTSGRWKAAGYRTAKAAGVGGSSTYSTKYKFPYAGKWRLQAYHSDAGHLTTRGLYSYLTVK